MVAKVIFDYDEFKSFISIINSNGFDGTEIEEKENKEIVISNNFGDYIEILCGNLIS